MVDRQLSHRQWCNFNPKYARTIWYAYILSRRIYEKYV